MTPHPDILELELARTEEASAQTLRHLVGCAHCQAQLAQLEHLQAELGGAPGEIAIPGVLDAKIREAIDAALDRTTSRAPIAPEDSAEGAVADGTGTRVLRPSFWRRARPALAATAAVAATFVGILSFAGDNIRSLFGASADALAGNESRAPLGIEGHKALKDFSGYAPEAPEPEASAALAQLAPARTSRSYALVFVPGPGFTGVLKVMLRLPASRLLEGVESRHPGDALQKTTLAWQDDAAQVQLQITRDEASSDAIEVIVRVETDEDDPGPEPSIARAEIISATGTQTVSVSFGRR